MAAPDWDRYLIASNALDAETSVAEQELIDRLERVVFWQPRHARAQLALAEEHLRLFDKLQATAANPMSLPNVRDAVLQSQFPSRDAMLQWLSRAVGEHAGHLQKASWHARQALRQCPLQGRGYVYLAELCFLDGGLRPSAQACVDQALRVRPFDAAVLYAAANEAYLAGDPAKWLEYAKQAFCRGRIQQRQLTADLIAHAPAEGEGPMIDFLLREFQPDLEGVRFLYSVCAKACRPEQLTAVRRAWAEKAEDEAQRATDTEATTLWVEAQHLRVQLNEGPRALQCCREARKNQPRQLRCALPTRDSLDGTGAICRGGVAVAMVPATDAGQSGNAEQAQGSPPRAIGRRAPCRGDQGAPAMNRTEPFVDLHCHLLPGLDDGASGWDEAQRMAEMAVADGIATIVATPHQLGGFAKNDAATVRLQVVRLQELLEKRKIPLRVLAGGDVRIEPELVGKLQDGGALSLADRRRHVLLELPHEIYTPLDRLLGELKAVGIAGILSHPERNQGLLNQPDVLPRLVDRGCLLQITAGSLTGMFGSRSRRFAETLIQQGLVHFVSTDAHGLGSRPPLLSPAFARVADLVGGEAALELCCRNPQRVVCGAAVPTICHTKAKSSWFTRLVQPHFRSSQSAKNVS